MPSYSENASLVSRIADLERRIKAQETAPRSTATNIGRGGITVSGGGAINVSGGGGINVTGGGDIAVSGGGSVNVADKGSVNVTGAGGIVVSGKGGIVIGDGGSIKSSDFDGKPPSTAGKNGWFLGGAGDSAIFNTLTLRDGIVGNDALTNPVSSTHYYDFNSGFTVSHTGSTVITRTITVPKGFTAVVISLYGRVYGVNTDTSTTRPVDYLYARLEINGWLGTGIPFPATNNNGSVTANAPLAVKMVDLAPSSTFKVSMVVWTEWTNWGTSTANTADLTGTVTWFR